MEDYYICERKKGQGRLGCARILAQTTSVEIAKEIVKSFKENHPDKRIFITKQVNMNNVFVKGDL